MTSILCSYKCSLVLCVHFSSHAVWLLSGSRSLCPAACWTFSLECLQAPQLNKSAAAHYVLPLSSASRTLFVLSVHGVFQCPRGAISEALLRALTPPPLPIRSHLFPDPLCPPSQTSLRPAASSDRPSLVIFLQVSLSLLRLQMFADLSLAIRISKLLIHDQEI